jgi:hypothetical protein
MLRCCVTTPLLHASMAAGLCNDDAEPGVFRCPTHASYFFNSEEVMAQDPVSLGGTL